VRVWLTCQRLPPPPYDGTGPLGLLQGMCAQPAGDIENHILLHGFFRACQFGNVEEAWFVLEVLC
jgi:hypothetical protein